MRSVLQNNDPGRRFPLDVVEKVRHLLSPLDSACWYGNRHDFTMYTHTAIPSFAANNDVGRMSALFRMGVTVPDHPCEPFRRSEDAPLYTIISCAAQYRSLPLLEAAFHELRTHGNTPDILSRFFPKDSTWDATCVVHVLEADFAPLLSHLFDNGLDPCLCINRDSLATHKDVSVRRIIHRAAELNAVTCLRVLRERLLPEEWRAALVEEVVVLGCNRQSRLFTPLALALHARATEAYEYLLQFVMPVGTSAAVRMPVELSEEPAFHQLASVLAATDELGTVPTASQGIFDVFPVPDFASYLPQAHALFAALDAVTCAEVRLILRMMHDKHCTLVGVRSGLAYAVDRGAVRALTVLLTVRPALLAPFADGALLAVSCNAATADVLLRAYTAGECARRRLASPEEDVDETAVRRSFATGSRAATHLGDSGTNDLKRVRLPTSAKSRDAVQSVSSFTEQLIALGRSDAAHLLLKEGAPKQCIPGNAFGLCVLPSVYCHKPAEGFKLASALIAALEAAGTLSDVLSSTSSVLLQCALKYGHIALAQLYLDKGVSPFPSSACDTSYFLSIASDDLSADVEKRCRYYATPVHDMRLPAKADSLLASLNPETLTRETARAYAAAADAEEERLLAGVLLNPGLLYDNFYFPASCEAQLFGLFDVARYKWIVSLKMCLGARWLCERMREHNLLSANTLLAHQAEVFIVFFTSARIKHRTACYFMRYLSGRGLAIEDMRFRVTQLAMLMRQAPEALWILLGLISDPLSDNTDNAHDRIFKALYEPGRSYCPLGLSQHHIADLVAGGARFSSSLLFRLCSISSERHCLPGNLAHDLRVLLGTMRTALADRNA